MKAINLDDIYGSPLFDWERIERRLAEGLPQAPGTGGPDRHTCWLTTINSNGSPHVTGIGALWIDGTFWFETGERTRKARNIALDPRCALSVATHEFDLSRTEKPPRSPTCRPLPTWRNGGPPKAGRRELMKPGPL